MTNTPTNTPTATTSSRSAYLPKLPDDWAYSVHLDSESQSVRVQPSADGGWAVIFHPSGAGRRQVDVADLAEALRTAANGAKVLDKVAKSEEEARRAREEALSLLTGSAEPDDDLSGQDDPTEDVRVVEAVQAS